MSWHYDSSPIFYICHTVASMPKKQVWVNVGKCLGREPSITFQVVFLDTGLALLKSIRVLDPHLGNNLTGCSPVKYTVVEQSPSYFC